MEARAPVAPLPFARYAPCACFTACAALLFAAHADAQPFPSRPIRIVVPYPPGGSNDIFARYVGGALAERLNRQVVVDNRPGGAGNIAMQEVANSTDEHTLILGHTGTLAVNPYILPDQPYDASGWTLPLSMDVDVYAAKTPLSVSKETLTMVESRPDISGPRVQVAAMIQALYHPQRA